jgi:hypothetical protein
MSIDISPRHHLKPIVVNDTAGGRVSWWQEVQDRCRDRQANHPGVKAVFFFSIARGGPETKNAGSLYMSAKRC